MSEKMNSTNTRIHEQWKRRENELHRQVDEASLRSDGNFNHTFHQLSGQASIYGTMVRALENDLAEASLEQIQLYVESYLKHCRYARDTAPFNSLNNLQAAGECMSLREMNDELLHYLEERTNSERE